MRRLAASGATRATLCATAEGGWLARALEELRRFSAAEVATGLAPELLVGTADAADAAAADAADAATLLELQELGELLRRLQVTLSLTLTALTPALALTTLTLTTLTLATLTLTTLTLTTLTLTLTLTTCCRRRGVALGCTAGVRCWCRSTAL